MPLSAVPVKDEAREIRTPNLLIWSQTRYRCAIAPLCHVMVLSQKTWLALVHSIAALRH